MTRFDFMLKVIYCTACMGDTLLGLNLNKVAPQILASFDVATSSFKATTAVVFPAACKPFRWTIEEEEGFVGLAYDS